MLILNKWTKFYLRVDRINACNVRHKMCGCNASGKKLLGIFPVLCLKNYQKNERPYFNKYFIARNLNNVYFERNCSNERPLALMSASNLRGRD